jgi:antitoxin Phd
MTTKKTLREESKRFGTGEAVWSLQDAKNKFSAVVEAARRDGPQTVTKRGEPAVVVLAAEEYERLRQLEKDKKPSFIEFLLSGPRGDFELPERPKVIARDIEF